jgi:hypothetical protein
MVQRFRQSPAKLAARKKLLAALAVICSLTTLMFSQPPRATGSGSIRDPDPVSARKPGRTRITPTTLKEVKHHTLAAAYYSVEENLSATLTLNNKGPQPLNVQLSLFNLAGERLDVPSVTVEGTSHRVIDLREYAMAGTAFEQGSVQVVYHGMELQMGAQVKLVDTEHGVIFDEQLVEPSVMFASSRLEGVWWLPAEQCNVRLVVSNTTGSPLAVNVRVDGIAPVGQETQELSPYAPG